MGDITRLPMRTVGPVAYGNERQGDHPKSGGTPDRSYPIASSEFLQLVVRHGSIRKREIFGTCRAIPRKGGGYHATVTSLRAVTDAGSSP